MRSRWWPVVGLGVLFVLAYVVFVCTPGGQRVDAAAFGQLPEVDAALGRMLQSSRLVVPALFALLACAAAVNALVRGRWRDVAAATVLVVGSSGLAVIAKPLLPRPDFGPVSYAWNTFPSGHLAVTLALVCATLWLAPAPIVTRALRMVLWVIATAFGWGLVLSYGHRQADVAGAALLVAIVAAAEVALRREVAPVSAATWGRLALIAGLGVVSQLVSDYVPGWDVLRFLGAAGTVLLIAASCGAALVLVPSAAGSAAVQGLVRVRDAREVERPSAG